MLRFAANNITQLVSYLASWLVTKQVYNNFKFYINIQSFWKNRWFNLSAVVYYFCAKLALFALGKVLPVVDIYNKTKIKTSIRIKFNFEILAYFLFVQNEIVINQYKHCTSQI